MAALPKKYEWLYNEGAPKMVVEWLKIFGTIETPGQGNNPTILAWANEIGGNVADVFKADSIPWCGLAMGVVAQRAGKELPKSPLWALSWSNFGNAVEKDAGMLGDALVFVRNGGGHIGTYIAESKDTFHVLGGNTSDQVKIAEISKSRLYAVRRPIYKTGQPTNVRKIFINASGQLSTNEQ